MTNAEHERLAMLLEEMGEAVQIIGKILRHGYESCDPTKGEDAPMNRSMLEKELGDIKTILRMMFTAGDLNSERIERRVMPKLRKLQRYVHYNDGVINDMLAVAEDAR